MHSDMVARVKTDANDKMTRKRSAWLDELVRFLENRGDNFLSWRDGCIVVESYYDKQFRAIGGDTNRLISFFEDYCNMKDAARHYIAEMREAHNAKGKRRGI